MIAANFAKYDVIASPRLASDVPLTYASRAEYDFAQKPIEKRTDVLAVAFISNCELNNNRMEYGGIGKGECKHTLLWALPNDRRFKGRGKRSAREAQCDSSL